MLGGISFLISRTIGTSIGMWPKPARGKKPHSDNPVYQAQSSLEAALSPGGSFGLMFETPKNKA
jgi:hypothetical protein